MADIKNNNKLISVDGLTIYHNKLAKLLSNTYLTKTDASNTYLTPKQGDDRYILLNWADRYVQYDVDASQQKLNSITLKNDTLTAKKIISLSAPVENNDITNKLYVDNQDNKLNTQYNELNTQLEEAAVKLYSTQQELNELKASLYGYVFGEDTANFSKLDISALPSMINNNNVAYNTRLLLNNVKGKTVKWTQLVSTGYFGISRTINGITFIIDKPTGTIICNGTSTAATTLLVVKETSKIFQATPNDIIYLKGCPSGGSGSTYYLAFYGTTYNDFGSGVYDKLSNRRENTTDTINTTIAVAIEIASGVTMSNKIFRPQLFNVSNIYGLGNEPATKEDFNKDYPYNVYPYGNQEILTTKVSGIKISAGYKNLLDKSKFEATQTINGVTFTNNGDGSYTVNGTASAKASFAILPSTEWIKKIAAVNTRSVFILQGCPNGGSNSTYFLNYGYYAKIDTGSGNLFVTGANDLRTGGITNISISIIIQQGTVCDNLVFKPQLINLTNTYGAGNEPKTVAQFNQDFPDIDNIPYPEQTISFDEQTLYGINDVQDTLQVVKENDGYKLQKIENIGNVDMGTLSWAVGASATEDKMWYAGRYPNQMAIDIHYNIPNMLTKEYITMTPNNVTNAVYNKSISKIGNNNYIIIRDTAYTTTEDLTTSLSGQILYYAKRTPVTTILATLTKNQVTALFTKGYCVEILGNDDNNVIVRPDVKLDMAIKLIGGGTNE